jgi:hypothetical protein
MSPAIAIRVLNIARRLQYAGESPVYSCHSEKLILLNLKSNDRNSAENMRAQEVPPQSMIVKIAANVNILFSKVVRCLYYNRLIEELHEGFTSNDPC